MEYFCVLAHVGRNELYRCVKSCADRAADKMIKSGWIAIREKRGKQKKWPEKTEEKFDDYKRKACHTMGNV